MVNEEYIHNHTNILKSTLTVCITSSNLKKLCIWPTWCTLYLPHHPHNKHQYFPQPGDPQIFQTSRRQLKTLGMSYIENNKYQAPPKKIILDKNDVLQSSTTPKHVIKCYMFQLTGRQILQCCV